MSASIKEKRLVSARRTSRRPSVSMWSNSSITPRRSVSLQWNLLARIRPSSQPKTHETRWLPTADQWAKARSLFTPESSAMPRRLVDSRGLAPLRGALAARSALLDSASGNNIAAKARPCQCSITTPRCLLELPVHGHIYRSGTVLSVRNPPHAFRSPVVLIRSRDLSPHVLRTIPLRLAH